MPSSIRKTACRRPNIAAFIFNRNSWKRCTTIRLEVETFITSSQLILLFNNAALSANQWPRISLKLRKKWNRRSEPRTEASPIVARPVSKHQLVIKTFTLRIIYIGKVLESVTTLRRQTLLSQRLPDTLATKRRSSSSVGSVTTVVKPKSLRLLNAHPSRPKKCTKRSSMTRWRSKILKTTSTNGLTRLEGKAQCLAFRKRLCHILTRRGTWSLSTLSIKLHRLKNWWNDSSLRVKKWSSKLTRTRSRKKWLYKNPQGKMKS